MIELLRDMYFHQVWADAEMWKSLEAYPVSLENERIRKTLHHMYEAQRAFLLVIKGEPLQIKRRRDFANIIELKTEVKNNHVELLKFIDKCSNDKLDEKIKIPWFKNPPLTLAIKEALLQVVMHSQYHRGQCATRLKELSGETPLTDIIAWYWKEKPEAVWK